MQYSDSVQQVLLRKINKAEQDLLQLKLDYCRFIFGLTHRSKVEVEGQVYHVRSVNVDSMVRKDDGSFSAPEVTGVPVDSPVGAEASTIGKQWILLNATQQASD
ncbi:hypothetical protein [Marinobacter caseinilyticus]|uniref:hypothetical protein n=1 Tax=Marinobacter caseinilyticus TaxID=2692195 RepID=UPI00140D8A8D|nr:hypothetical protein [Marinobacter caseinilyticus]